MSFPFHDRYWTDTAGFVEKHRAPEESVLAPDLFWWRFERIFRYANTQLRPAERYDWAILHKGELDRLAPGFLPAIQDEMQPVFANEVFVVWARRPGMPRLAETDPHLAAYFGLAGRAPPAANGAAAPPIDGMLPDRGVIAKFDAMSPRELREAMDAYYRNGGYRYVTLRDKAYFSELDRCVGQLLPRAAEARILDIACGNGRVAALLPAGACRTLVGIDVSRVAVELARQRWAERRECGFAVMDACRLGFPDASFDTATFVDAAEHVGDIEGVISEAARVLAPGGDLVVTAANRMSLNQIVTRKLGFPEFVSNYQHIREFALDEFEALLHRHGFAVAERLGAMLYPYWGIPGIDGILRNIIDNDPELVEIQRDMGARIDPRHAYAFVLRARKER